ncbi:MAG: DUF4280 domain-containing protein [Anaerotignum sp.]
MGAVVVNGAKLMCPFGTMMPSLITSAQMTVLGLSKPIATIMDMAPGSNIPPFGMCSSLANPQVAAATAAALGVLTPQPCMMAPAGPWQAAKPTVLVGGKPILTQECTLLCAMGMGMISIVSPGQMKIVTG